MVKKTDKKGEKGKSDAEKLKDLHVEELEDLPLVGSLFRGLGKLIDLAKKAEEAGGEFKKEGIIKGLGGREDMRGVYGFTIRTGLGEQGKWRKPHVESFGNIRKTKEGLKVEETREPLVDVFDEKDYVRVVAELPGISEKDITIDIKGDMLMLEAFDGGRKFAKEILLPSKVDEASKEIFFKNGVLEVKFKKAGE